MRTRTKRKDDMKELPLKIQHELKDYFEKHNVAEAERKEITEKAKLLYRKMLYDPQEPIGVVAAQSLSEPSTQMSLDYNEKVIVKRNGTVRILPIGMLIDKVVEANASKEADGWEVADVSGEGIYVPSITADEKIEWSPVLAFSRHSAPETLLEIRTSSGRKIVATDSHSFVVRKDNKIVPVPGSELKAGCRLPSLLFLPENCIHQLDTTTILEGQKFAKKRLPDTLGLDRELGWIFGAYLAEGNCTRNFVSFSNTDEEFLSRIREFAGRHGLGTNEYDNTSGFALSHDIRINSKQLSTLFLKTCGTGSWDKRVPEFAYSSGEEFVAGLISGYFDGDGNVSVNKGMIRVSSRSAELIDGIVLLLARFRIFATKSKGEERGLIIPYKYARTFRGSIGLNVHGKKEALDILCELPENTKDITDMFEGFGNIMHAAASKLSYPTRYVNNFTKRQRIGRSALVKYISIFEKLSESRGVDIKKELGIMKTMARSDVVWDSIESIRRVKPSCKYVYDFTVKGTETFTTFEGIVTHNTMRTYHFAGTAGIQVTLGLPRMMEIFDARKEPRTPMMTVKLKPGLDMEQVKGIAENIKEIKLRDMVVSTLLDMTDLWIKFKLDAEKMKYMGIDADKMAKNIRIKNTEASLEGADTIVVKTKKGTVSNLRKLKYVVLDTHIKGIKGISQVVVSKEGNEWTISTLGSNLKKVFEIEGVDTSRTTSNNIFETYDVLGIEAARNAIIYQTRYTMEEQGLGVDIRYVMLLADVMTASGEVQAIGRYGVAGQKASVLVRASFEETKKHMTAAAIRGETDPLLGTIENIMLNQVAPVGTGSFDLVGTVPGAPKGEGKINKKEEEPEAEEKSEEEE